MILSYRIQKEKKVFKKLRILGSDIVEIKCGSQYPYNECLCKL